jgi:hypothetical protein
MGDYRINRWRMINAMSPGLVDGLCAAKIGDNQGLIDRLATHLSARPPQTLVPDSARMRAPIPKAGKN